MRPFSVKVMKSITNTELVVGGPQPPLVRQVYNVLGSPPARGGPPPVSSLTFDLLQVPRPPLPPHPHNIASTWPH